MVLVAQCGLCPWCPREGEGKAGGATKCRVVPQAVQAHCSSPCRAHILEVPAPPILVLRCLSGPRSWNVPHHSLWGHSEQAWDFLGGPTCCAPEVPGLRMALSTWACP